MHPTQLRLSDIVNVASCLKIQNRERVTSEVGQRDCGGCVDSGVCDEVVALARKYVHLVEAKRR